METPGSDDAGEKDRGCEKNESGDDGAVDITCLIEDCAASLSMSEPFVCNPDVFSLHDAMAATQLMDAKMDCCEIPLSKIAPPGRVPPADDRMVFPRPAPTGLRDEFTPLPWEDLSFEDASLICLEILVRLQSLLSGASVGESTFTCLYAHEPVLSDMCAQLFQESTLEDQFERLDIKSMEKAPNDAQLVVFASALALVETTDIFRGVVINADIYEEEDFAANTNNIRFFTEGRDTNTLRVLETAIAATKTAAKKNGRQTSEMTIVLLVLEFQFGFLSVCSSMAQITSKDITSTVKSMQVITRRSVAKLESLLSLLKQIDHDASDESSLIRATFDSFVNRPTVGNTPVRKVSFLSPIESVPIIMKITSEIDWSVCGTMLQGSTLGRMQRMLDRVTRSDVNILSRSLILLNLYFEDHILGQHSLHDMIVQNMKQFCNVPASLLEYERSNLFIVRLAKPIYDTLKLRTLSRNRQRGYIEAVLIHDWTTLQHEAHIVDVHYRRDHGLDNSTPPYFCQYVLSYLIRLMDRHLSAGIEVGLFHGHSELSMAYWYRDFLLSALLTNVSMMRRTKELAKNNVKTHETTKGSRGKKKGHKHKANGGAAPKKTAEDKEDDLEVLLIGFRRMMCRGILRFIASIRQAGLVKEQNFEFTSTKKVFQKRFDVYQEIRQPPPLSYEDFRQGSDFSVVPQPDLLQSTTEWFQSCKSTAERLLEGYKALDSPRFSPIQDSEILSLVKVCVGNSVYLLKLRQVLSNPTPEKPIKVDFDFQTTDEFCTVKIS